MQPVNSVPKVLLINPNTCRIPYPVFPIGLAYLQASLKAHNIDTMIWDGMFDSEATLHDLLNDPALTLVGITIRNVDNVSIDDPKDFIEKISTWLKPILSHSKAPAVLGGAGFSIFPQEILHEFGVSFGMTGEGEASLPLLANALHQQKVVHNIPGLLLNTPDGIIQNPPVYLKEEEIPICRPDPNWLRSYSQFGGLLNIQTQRGCALHCCYCTYPVIEGKCYRRRNPEDVADEMAYLEENGFKFVFIVDSVFNTQSSHVTEICNAIIKRKLQIKWGCFLRPKGLTKEMMALMVEAGLSHIEFGSDSFSDSVLKAYGKSFRFEDIRKASNLAREFKVNYCHFLILGGPGETPSTLKESVANSIELGDPLIFAFCGMRVYPHTPLHQQLQKSSTPSDNLLRPTFYLSEEFSLPSLKAAIQKETEHLSNWISGQLPPEFENIAARMRKKGVQGPLWEYLTVMRRFDTPR